MRIIFLIVLLAIALLATNNAFGSRIDSFVKPEYHIKNGNVISLEQMAENPYKYFSPGVYEYLRLYIAKKMGRQSLSDQEFRALIVSENARRVHCIIGIKTAGFDHEKNSLFWHSRPCYEGEMLIQIKIDGKWVTVASQGCYNPVDIVYFSPPPYANSEIGSPVPVLVSSIDYHYRSDSDSNFMYKEYGDPRQVSVAPSIFFMIFGFLWLTIRYRNRISKE